jgi:FAD/FMN-containing dehydrogenase
MMSDESVAAAVRALTEQLGPERVVVSGPAYEAVLAIWNGAVEHRPAVVVRCTTAADVQVAVRVAGEYGVPLSVRGGGHDWAGRSLRDNGLVVDLSGMRDVTVDAEARVATVAGGARAADLIAEVSQYGLSAVTGTVGAVGVAGLTLAGGYGPLGGVAGLALDNLLGVEVVLADGSLVVADAENEPELFWATRGGGGNFGVVTSLRVRLHPITKVLAGFIMFPWDQAASVLRGFADLARSAPDELTAQCGVLSDPTGAPALLISPAWSGDLVEGEKVITQLEQLGTPLMSQVAEMPYAGVLALFDPFLENGRHVDIQTRSVAAIDDDFIKVLIIAGESRTSPLTGIVVHHFHGAATRVPLESTAFGIRQEHFMIEIVTTWEPGDATAHREWSHSVSEAFAPMALPGGYPNLLGPDEREQIDQSYGSNTTRLREAKAQYDPAGVFSATGLPS